MVKRLFLLALALLFSPAVCFAQVSNGNATRLQGRLISPALPSDNMALVWLSSNQMWQPRTVSGSSSTITPNYYMVTGNNLSDVRSTSSAIYNLGLGSTANVVFGGVSVNGNVSANYFIGNGSLLTGISGSVTANYYVITGNNLSDLRSTSSAVYNLGLGTTANVYFGGVSVNGTISGNYLLGKQLDVLSNVVAAATTTLNMTLGNFFDMSQDTNITTFSWTNVPASGNVFKFYLRRTKDATSTARTISWPSGMKWNYGVSPVLSSTASAIDIFTFLTTDGGTTWYGMINGQGFQ